MNEKAPRSRHGAFLEANFGRCPPKRAPTRVIAAAYLRDQFREWYLGQKVSAVHSAQGVSVLKQQVVFSAQAVPVLNLRTVHSSQAVFPSSFCIWLFRRSNCIPTLPCSQSR